MAITRRLARPLLASVFFVGSYQVLKDPSPVRAQAQALTDRIAPLVRSRGIPFPSDPAVVARAHAATQLVAATTLTLGRAPRLSAGVLAVSLLPSVLSRDPQHAGPTDRRAQVQHAARTASMVGGLVLAAVDTEGRPGVAWRTRRVARDARREARHLARTARLEARLAARTVPRPLG